MGDVALGDVETCAADAGDVGIGKLSFRSRVMGGAVSIGSCSSAYGGVAGCDDSGPPPGVGGPTSEGVRLGVSDAGGGMSVPSVRL